MANKLKEMGVDTTFARKQLEKHGWAEGIGKVLNSLIIEIET